MLPRAEVIKNEIYEICKNSPDVEIGQKFSGVMYNDELRDKPCHCIGKREDFERYFVTEDGLCYFTATNGCGEKDGRLYAVGIWDQLRFEKPTDIVGLRDYVKNFRHPESVVGAVRLHTERIAAERYIKALEELEGRKAERGIFWVVDGELLAFPFDENDTEGVAKSGNTYNHKLLWEAKKPCNKPFDYYPRGRVEITKNGEVIIFMNPNIGEEFIPKIKAAFGLTAEPKIIYDHSEHYKCHLDK